MKIMYAMGGAIFSSLQLPDPPDTSKNALNATLGVLDEDWANVSLGQNPDGTNMFMLSMSLPSDKSKIKSEQLLILDSLGFLLSTIEHFEDEVVAWIKQSNKFYCGSKMFGDDNVITYTKIKDKKDE